MKSLWNFISGKKVVDFIADIFATQMPIANIEAFLDEAFKKNSHIGDEHRNAQGETCLMVAVREFLSPHSPHQERAAKIIDWLLNDAKHPGHDPGIFLPRHKKNDKRNVIWLWLDQAGKDEMSYHQYQVSSALVKQAMLVKLVDYALRNAQSTFLELVDAFWRAKERKNYFYLTLCCERYHQIYWRRIDLVNPDDINENFNVLRSIFKGLPAVIMYVLYLHYFRMFRLLHARRSLIWITDYKNYECYDPKGDMIYPHQIINIEVIIQALMQDVTLIHAQSRPTFQELYSHALSLPKEEDGLRLVRALFNQTYVQQLNLLNVEFYGNDIIQETIYQKRFKILADLSVHLPVGSLQTNHLYRVIDAANPILMTQMINKKHTSVIVDNILHQALVSFQGKKDDNLRLVIDVLLAQGACASTKGIVCVLKNDFALALHLAKNARGALQHLMLSIHQCESTEKFIQLVRILLTNPNIKCSSQDYVVIIKLANASLLQMLLDKKITLPTDALSQALQQYVTDPAIDKVALTDVIKLLLQSEKCAPTIADIQLIIQKDDIELLILCLQYQRYHPSSAHTLFEKLTYDAITSLTVCDSACFHFIDFYRQILQAIYHQEPIKALVIKKWNYAYLSQLHQLIIKNLPLHAEDERQFFTQAIAPILTAILAEQNPQLAVVTESGNKENCCDKQPGVPTRDSANVCLLLTSVQSTLFSHFPESLSQARISQTKPGLSRAHTL